MRQLASLDAQFLAIEDARTAGHVAALLILDPGPAPGGRLTLDAVRELVASRLHMLRPLRERMVGVPFNLAHPYWIEDPDFDLDFHLRELALPPPGDERQLAEQIARIHSRSLDRSRPLWELYLIHGLDRGRVGLLIKVHHAAIDGAAGLELLGALLDQTPEGAPVEATPPARREPVPGRVALLARGLAGLPGQPLRALRAVPNVLPNLDQMPMTRALPGAAAASSLIRRAARVTAADQRGRMLERPEIRAPRTVFNGRISAQRRVAFASVPLDEVKRIKDASDTTVNDVVRHTRSLCAALLASSPRRTARRAAPGDDSGFGARRGRGRPSGQPGIDDARADSYR